AALELSSRGKLSETTKPNIARTPMIASIFLWCRRKTSNAMEFLEFSIDAYDGAIRRRGRRAAAIRGPSLDAPLLTGPDTLAYVAMGPGCGSGTASGPCPIVSRIDGGAIAKGPRARR